MIALAVLFITLALAIGYWIGARYYVKFTTDKIVVGERFETTGGSRMEVSVGGASFTWEVHGKKVTLTLSPSAVETLSTQWARVKAGGQ